MNSNFIIPFHRSETHAVILYENTVAIYNFATLSFLSNVTLYSEGISGFLTDLDAQLFVVTSHGVYSISILGLFSLNMTGFLPLSGIGS